MGSDNHEYVADDTMFMGANVRSFLYSRHRPTIEERWADRVASTGKKRGLVICPSCGNKIRFRVINLDGKEYASGNHVDGQPEQCSLPNRNGCRSATARPKLLTLEQQVELIKMAVAKQPGLAICWADLICSLFNSGKP